MHKLKRILREQNPVPGPSLQLDPTGDLNPDPDSKPLQGRDPDPLQDDWPPEVKIY